MDDSYLSATNIIRILSLLIAIIALLRPELTKLVRRFSNKIDFYPSDKIEIGFFDLGPTIGLHGTIRNRGGDQFIRTINLKLTRQRDNATNKYTWGLFRQLKTVSRGNIGVEQNVTCELANSFLIEGNKDKNINIQFHDTATKERYADKVLELMNQFNNFIYRENIALNDQQSIVNAQESFKVTPQNNELIIETFNTLGNEFYWESGDYEIRIEIVTDNPKKSFFYTDKFSITAEQVKRLRLNNVALIQTAMANNSPPNFIIVELQTKD